MGRIKKAAGPKHEATLSPALSEFVATASKLPLGKLPSHLRTFPSRWPFPRGDLYHWIPLLDRFDIILESFNRHYGLNLGPQIKPFTQALLENGIVELDGTWVSAEKEPDGHLSFSKDGDRELVECILQFSTLLVENCGNRSLYNSSDRLGDLLNTTSLSLLSKSLRLAVRLAQRYHASRQRGGSASQHLNNALLASHYNIDLEHVQKLANPFVKIAPLPSTPVISTPLSGKGKEKTFHTSTGRRKSADDIPTSDLYAMARDEESIENSLGSKGKKAQKGSSNKWQEWGSLQFTYYYNPPTSTEEKKISGSAQDADSPAPPTPTPARRASGLSRPSRLSSSEESSNTASNSMATKSEESVVGGMRHLEIPYSKIASTELEEILESTLPDIPRSSRYDFLCRLRVAHALSHSLSTRRQILGIRILAVTNLAYIYPETSFQQKLLQQDSDEPRRLQLPYQLADLIHPPGNGNAGIPIELKTIALGALEALTKHKNRASDVCTALGVNVNHGVLLYILRKAAAELAVEDEDDEPIEADEWREALYSLLEALPSSGPRTAESLVAAGLFDILIEVLNLRTNKAERNHPKILIFLNTTLYAVRDAFQTFANAKGLDTISELTAWEVSSSLQRAQAGGGLPAQYRNQVMDYQVPYFQQQTLRWIFKFINHMMSHGNANFDRLLRNLIDSPKLLNGLLTVISNAPVFGSNVWSGSVNILSSFIHNEPTSYAVIAEAGLSKGFLEAIIQRSISNAIHPNEQANADPNDMVAATSNESEIGHNVVAVDPTGGTIQTTSNLKSDREHGRPLGQGILPATDAIVTIPHAFGAICLNANGLQLFLDSKALESFFEIFRSPDHIKSLVAEVDLPRMLGNSFDELVRHHPRLRHPVMESVIAMLADVSRLCKTRASSEETGAKLWTTEDDSSATLDSIPYQNAPHGNDEDINMRDVAEPSTESEIMRNQNTNGNANRTEEHAEPSVTTYINVAIKFMAGFFDNTSLCSSFIESGGIKHLLEMATLPSLPYDFNSDLASQEIARVLHVLIDAKPHLVLPSLLKETQDTVDELKSFIEHDGRSAFFSHFTGSTKVNLQTTEQGTAMVKSLVRVHTLCNMLFEAFSTSAFTNRPNHTIYTQLNLTDIYIPLIKSLGRLHRACIWEEILLQKSTPDSIKESTGFSDIPAVIGEENIDARDLFVHDSGTHDNSSANQTNPFSPHRTPESARQDENSALYKNVQSLRYLLSQIPTSITPFFQGLGKSLVTKRRADAYQRQCTHMVAEAIAKASIEQLDYEAPKMFDCAKDRYAYWIVVLTSISQLMIEGPLERPHSQCLVLIMQAFTQSGGLEAVKNILKKFLDETEPKNLVSNGNFEEKERLASAYGGIKIILSFFSQITSAKCIVDSTQTQCITSHDRDRDQPYFFLPAQFLVELRMAVLPVVKSMWESSFVDKASNSILKSLIDILKTILDSEQEQGAFKKSDPVPNRIKPRFKVYNIAVEKVNTLQTRQFEEDIAREALYRCLNNRDMAEEYCRAIEGDRIPSLPPPPYDQEKPKTPSPLRTPRRQDSEATIPDPEHVSMPATEVNSSVEFQGAGREEHQTEAVPNSAAAPPPPAPNWPSGMDVDEGEGMVIGIDSLLSITELLNNNIPPGSEPGSSNDVSTPVRTNITEAARVPDLITLDDLEEERSEVRSGLIDRALDVLNIHGDITWELAELITVGASKAPDAVTMRKEIGATLVQSLISYQMEEDFRPAGKKIAAGANLLALVMQEKEFYDVALDELRESLGQLCKFIKIFPEQTPDEPSPWVGQVLLIVEKMLAEDVQPEQIRWTPPESDNSPADDTIVEMTESLVPFEEKLQILDAVTQILPRIGKDETLALSIARILVILSRNREIANKLGEKHNMQRLFLTVRQLSGATNEKLQTSFMLVLRHIIEDDETLRQIMRSEIVANFETRASRPTDTTGYVRHMYHLVLRSPSIFVEMTNETLKLQQFDPSQRPQVLVLKAKSKPTDTDTAIEGSGNANSSVEPSNENIKSSTEQPGVISPEKPKALETKAPVVEHPDGVIHYLLSQLLSYKDVEDKEIDSTSKETVSEVSRLDTTDVEMANGLSSPSRPSTPTMQGEPVAEKKADKPELKAEQHPIYVYRCFLLQCLTELLSSYNRCKIEFINFSRKADPKAMTPSKPRSGVLNYLLNAVIPVGTLNSEDSLSYRKKSITSNWGISTVVSLCWKTGEKGYSKKHDHSEDEQEPDLLFVRKFVLEHALKAYKDATSSSEPLEVKYARMLSIADLFSRMLSGRLSQNPNAIVNDIVIASQEEISKIMFEKGFISAFTSSIADIDLNFPNAKRAVRYILKPLKVLTSTAIVLSESSDISTTLGTTDDDEISTASSASELDDEREETPDLFRHSALGILEPGRDEESSSESSDEDEDMYDDEYDDGMEYEEEIERDGDEVISDEDEEIEGAGHLEGLPGDVGMDVEVVLDGDDDEGSDEDPDDSEDMDEMDDGGEIEIIDEINGDDENGSLADGEEEWQDEDEDAEDFHDQDGLEHDHDHDQNHNQIPTVRDIVREIHGGDGLPGLDGGHSLELDIENEVYMDDAVRNEDDENDDDEEDEMDDEDVIYEPEFDDEDPMPDPPWGWEGDEEPPVTLGRGPRHHHHHHHHGNRIPSPWTILPHGMDRGVIMPTYRSHRGNGAPRGADDGTNPLLQRHGTSGNSPGSNRNERASILDAATGMTDWVHGMEPGAHRGGPVSFVNNIISAIGHGGPGFGTIGGPHGALHFQIAGNGGHMPLPREIQAVLGLRRPPQEVSRSSRDDPMYSATFLPTTTVTRWQEEARLLFGNAYSEKTLRAVNSLLRVLVPPAIEEENARKARNLQQVKEQRERLEEEQRIAKEKAEKEAQEKKEQEEREAAERAAAETNAAVAQTSNGSLTTNPQEASDQNAMEGVESAQATDTTTTEERAPEAGPSEESERVRATFRGREVDITGLGIDLEYLDALPEELREEVLMQQLAEQRSQAAAAGEEPTDISREFLEALPPEIREELLQQEAQDRRRREREDNRRRAAANGSAPAARAEEMDPASFLASLDPHLRQAVLMEQDEEVLAQLPATIAAEARALGSDRTMHRWGDFPRLNAGRLNAGHLPRPSRGLEQSAKKPQRKQIVQMLDKAGVATLLRLMFVPLQGPSWGILNEILHNVAQNRQNRAEIVSLLLSILQDGSADVNAVERSFQHLSLRAKQPTSQKTPQTPKRILTGQMNTPTNSEMTPLMVIQQCLNALVHLTSMNPHIPSFFLTEHETSPGIKGKSKGKGKAKETRASKFALNALLSLLDRELIMESSSCMEQLSTLLQSITHPLTILLRKEKDKPVEEVANEESSTMAAQASSANGDNSQGPLVNSNPEDTPMIENAPIDAPTDSLPVSQNANDLPADQPTTSAQSAEESEGTKKPESEEKPKNKRNLTPPFVPESNLRLVVNILAARECSGKTFRDTLSTINNLSAIPDAREIFGKELIEQAQDLGEAILRDLDELVPQIRSAGTGTDVQGIALAKFSPSSSDQAKLLRVLTALDYLFDPKRNGGKTKPATENDKPESSSAVVKDDLLTTLYENSTFGPLWTKLSECLGAIRQRENMLNIATILLPLVEALMVVCKNTTLKEGPLIQAAKEFAIMSPPPESRMEGLFFKFTEDHRKILNDLVRHNPKLMIGTFSLLVKNPKVLEFDNKRNYFTRRLHSRGAEARHPQPPLQLSVRRDQAFLDSFKSLYYKSGDEMKYGKLSIRFHGEEGVDAGGVTREWFQVMSRQMFDANYALFVPVASDRTTFHPNKLSGVNQEHLTFFKFIGRVIGKALYEGRALDCHFSRAVYKRILGKPVSIKDMETLDLDYYKSLLWMLENDITDIITETFSIEVDEFGVTKIVDLIENGRSVPVTEENKQEYVQLVVEYRLTGSVKVQLEEFLKGFHDVIPSELISIFDEQELELLISGLPDIDVDDWKSNTEYHNYSASSSQIQWFWRAVRSFDKEERAKLLQFVTGTSKVPLNGFKELEGMNGFSRFNIHRDYGNKDRLPSSHTCFNQLDLPEYESYEALRQQVYTAMTAGSEYFGFA